MIGSLAVFLEGRHIRHLERNRGGTLSLHYRDEYSRGQTSTPILLSMPATSPFALLGRMGRDVAGGA